MIGVPDHSRSLRLAEALDQLWINGPAAALDLPFEDYVGSEYMHVPKSRQRLVKVAR
mgnify:CR=1 FL=1